MSLIKTVSLMLILSALVVMAGYLFGNGSLTMLFILLGIVLAMNLWAYWGSDGVVKRMAGAREVSEQEEPRLHHMVSEVARMADMPKPRVAVIENESPNAFATGRSPKRALVAVTTGLRRILDEEELRGVIAHEMAHIKNRDMLTMTIVAVLAGVISLIGTIAMWGMLFGGFGGGGRGGGGGYGAIVGIVGLIVVIVVMPLAAKMVSFTISRTRELFGRRDWSQDHSQPQRARQRPYETGEHGPPPADEGQQRQRGYGPSVYRQSLGPAQRPSLQRRGLHVCWALLHPSSGGGPGQKAPGADTLLGPAPTTGPFRPAFGSVVRCLGPRRLP